MEEHHQPYASDYGNRILASIQKAVYNMIVESAAKNELLVIGNEDGSFKHVPATEALEDLKKKLAIPPSPHDTPAPY